MAELKDIDGGARKIARANASSPEEGLELARTLAAECPEGFHLVRIEIQKSSKGRRAHVTVTFQPNRAY